MTSIVHPGLFGVNLLYDQRDEHGQDLIENGAVTDLVRVYKEYGFRYLRWPGGSVTENDACEDPKQFFRPVPKINFLEACDVCLSHGFKLHVVVPTRVWKDDNAGMAKWLTELRECEHAAIASVEIGNEYWGADKNTGVKLTAADYGQIARKLLPKLRDAIPNVPIFIQNAPHWTGDRSATIYDSLAPASVPALAGAVDHWYPQTWAGIDQSVAQFRVMRDTPSRFPSSEVWRLNVSEWNVSLDNNRDAMLGLDQGLALARMLWRMAAEGVSFASFWGFHYRQLANKIRGYRASGVSFDTAAGTIFKTFQLLNGFEPVETPISASKASTFRAPDGTLTTYCAGPVLTAGYEVVAGYEFKPVDDERTANIDETQPGAQQMAETVPATTFNRPGVFMVQYREAPVTVSPCNFLKRMMGLC